jgi:hypothetical protein
MLQRLKAPQGQGTVLEQIRDKKTWRSAKQLQQVAHQPAAVLALIQGRPEELRIAKFFCLLQSALLLKPIDERLDCRISNTFNFREAFQELAHRRGPPWRIYRKTT